MRLATMDPDDRELLDEFKAESLEHLGTVEASLLAIDSTQGDERVRLVTEMFRSLHSVKGTAGFFDLDRIQELAHAMENVLAALRDQTIAFTPTLSDLLLTTFDQLRRMVDALPEVLDLDCAPDREKLKAALACEPSEEPEQAEAEDFEQTNPVEATTAVAAPPPSDGTIRVQVRLLDRLMNLAGELVLSRNELASQLGDSGRETRSMIQTLDLVTCELQNHIMDARMQPASTVFRKFPRVVRDLARKLERKVTLELEGSDVELDRSILELLADPLTHLVRNALDHGVEAPEDRAAAGKPEEARLCIRARHEGGQVEIEIEDDGRGIDPERIRATAIEKGLLSKAAAERLGEREAVELIFAAGFSTAEVVTDVSGRGVGMDVVKANISKLGGKIEVESTFGEGTCLRIRLPLTLAIAPALIVESAGTCFAIPQTSVVEMIHSKDSVDRISGAEAFALRGTLLPLVRLGVLLGLGPPEPGAEGFVVVCRVDGNRYGLWVDAVLDSEEIVVKPLPSLLKRCAAYAGATLLGNGRVAMILDIGGIAARAALDFERPEEQVEARPDESERALSELILFTNAPDEQFAVDMREVLRFERCTVDRIQKIGHKEFIAYDGGSLELIRLEDRIAARPAEPTLDEMFVLIPRSQSRPAGILTTGVVDTVRTHQPPVRSPDDSPAVRGRMTIGDRVALVLDSERLMDPSVGDSA